MSCWALQHFLLVVRLTSTSGLIFSPPCAQSLHFSLTPGKHTPLSFILTSLNLTLGRDNTLRQVICTSLSYLCHSWYVVFWIVLPFVCLGRTGGHVEGWGCGAATMGRAQASGHSSRVHKDTFQSTLPAVAEGAVTEFVAVSLPLFLEVSHYWWGQPSPAPFRFSGTAGGSQSSHVLNPPVSVSALFLVFIILPHAAIALTN